jgi:hypothetical protein
MITLSDVNLNLAKEFLENLKDQTAYKFPDYLQNIYSIIIDDYCKQNPKFRKDFNYRECVDKIFKSNVPYTESDQKNHILEQFYCFFPTHYFKFLHSLVTTELENIENNSTNILTWQSVTFIDIGCGAGAGSLALLTLIIEYQKFLVVQNKPISPIRIYLIGLDPSKNMLLLYKQILEYLKDKFYYCLINIKYDIINRAFSEGIDELINRFKPLNNHSVFLGMSNVIRPLSDCFNRGETPAQESINQVLNGENFTNRQFGLAETRAIKSILEQWELDRLSLLSIATKDSNEWDIKSESMTQIFRNKIQISYGKGIIETTVRYYNPISSFFGKNKNPYPSKYYYDYSIFTNESYLYNQQLHSVLNLENIELAWSRSRRYILHENFADEAEIRLFDYDIERKLDRLCQEILAKQWKILNIEHSLFYNLPKNPNKSRPKILPRIEEQILSASIIQSCQINDEDLKERISHSHRLNEDRDEFLYDYWLDRWRDYIRETHKNAKNNSVFRSDIKGCYQYIKQKELLNNINKYLSTEKRITEILEKIIFRDFKNEVHEEEHTYGCGISQGHIASGFWAEVYLAIIDRIFIEPPQEQDYFRQVKLARYADDMVITYDKNIENFDKIEDELKTILKQLNLELSDEKTQRFPEDGQEYISETTLDEKLDELSQKFSDLLVYIYNINDDFIKQYNTQPEQFVSEYYKVIKLIGINISKPWLKRKISQYFKEKSEQKKKDLDIWQILGEISSKIFKRTIEIILNNNKKRINQQLEFTEFPIQSNNQKWLDEFKQQNKFWFAKLSNFKNELINLWKDNLSQLDKDNLPLKEEKQAQRRLKFVAGRLCTLGLEEIADDLVKIIIEKPWLVPVHFLCRSLANLDNAFELLEKTIENSTNSYVKSHAIRSLADIKSPLPEKGIELICDYIQSENKSICEKLKASEAILLIKQSTTVKNRLSQEKLQQLIEQEKDFYLIKNYILILGQVYGAEETITNYLKQLQERYFIDYVKCLDNQCKDSQCHNLILIDAIQFVLCNLNKNNLFSQDEPEILSKYYAKKYPVTEMETMTGSNSP